MQKTVLAAAAASALMTSLITSVGAVPAPRLTILDEATIATPVRDGCGWRRHWSPRLRHCVWDWRG